MRGLKCFVLIEMIFGECRIAHAARGLKWKHWLDDVIRPARSHRSRGAWIEMYWIIRPNRLSACRIAHAVRGLKLEV